MDWTCLKAEAKRLRSAMTSLRRIRRYRWGTAAQVRRGARVTGGAFSRFFERTSRRVCFARSHCELSSPSHQKYRDVKVQRHQNVLLGLPSYSDDKGRLPRLVLPLRCENQHRLRDSALGELSSGSGHSGSVSCRFFIVGLAGLKRCGPVWLLVN